MQRSLFRIIAHHNRSQYTDLRRILAESATEHGAKLRGGVHVTDIRADPQKPSVVLSTGEVLTADVVIGADGSHVGPYRSRRLILEALEQEDIEKPTGMTLFKCV